MSLPTIHTEKQPFIKRLAMNIRRHPLVYVFLLILAVYFILFCYWPMYGNIIAFQNYKPIKGIIGSKFVGFKQCAETYTVLAGDLAGIISGLDDINSAFG